MNEIDLNSLKLKTFTEQDALDYCSINNINSDNIIELYLQNNELTDISGVKLFKNLEKLDLGHNKLTDISVIKKLKNLKYLRINSLRLKSDQIKHINNVKSLKTLYCIKGFENMSDVNKLNKNLGVLYGIF